MTTPQRRRNDRWGRPAVACAFGAVLCLLIATATVSVSSLRQGRHTNNALGELADTLYARCVDRAASVTANRENLRGDLATLQSDVRFYRAQILTISGPTSNLDPAFAEQLLGNYRDVLTARRHNIHTKRAAIAAAVPPRCDELKPKQATTAARKGPR